MDKAKYKRLLLDKRWNSLRLRVLERDKYKCQKCWANDCRLSVHHKLYIEGKLPWEYPMFHLVTLCDGCHAKEHENRTIKSFVKKMNSAPTSYIKKKGTEYKSTKRPRNKKIWVEGKGLIKPPTFKI